MKFIHCADLHLDAAMNSGLQPEKAKERRGELLAAFSRLASVAENEAVTAIIIAGDLFDRNTVSVKSKKTVLQVISSHPSVDFLLLSGNHDELAITPSDTLPCNLKMFGEAPTSFDYDNVTVTGLSETLSEALNLNKERINIIVYHGSEGKDFRLRDLKGLGIDYIALGHYHSYSETAIDKRGVACYSGCLEGRGFDECGEKGYVLLETTDNGKLTHKFVPFAKRSILEINVDMTEADTFAKQSDALKAALNDVDRENIVRVNIVGSYEPDREKFYETLMADYKNEFYYFEAVDRSVIHIDPKDYINDISLKGEFIRLCIKEIPDENERSRVISCGIRALRGDDIE